jgi:hypothetical protein
MRISDFFYQYRKSKTTIEGPERTSEKMAKVRDPGEEEVRVKVYREEGKRTGGSQVSQQLVYCLHQQTERLTQHCNTQASLSLPSPTVETKMPFFFFTKKI